MTGMTTPAADRAEYEWEAHAHPDERPEPPEFESDPLLDSVYADVVAVTRGIAEIRRVADYLESQLR